MLDAGHERVKLDPASLDRLITWMDACAQRLGLFSAEQEKHLVEFRRNVSGLLAE